MIAIRICRLLWTGWIVLWVLWALGTKQSRKRLDFGRALSYMIPTFAGACLIFGIRDDLPVAGFPMRLIPGAAWLMELGVILTATGLLFAIWARANLGRNWSGLVTVKVEHQLVRTGPYRLVRHPIYSGIVLATLGTAICRRHVWGFAGVALMWLGFWLKSRLEERFMVQTFGAEYEDYRRSTGALIPRLL